ncbi:hypothetical protein FDP41_009558 [Naegleria fowleri]|uniref:J domain-containing protein n=1 Tax=Naegleria fowleri TaxID=5763 RepID=A0A6A5BDK8_NAEFO|nr:uncharacterized protein FDP41_009558 [Naegleria fowleri]KAF0972150.1 hypothetical protein FDP41_009558 [Naegleria fowleri]CAG4710751.1 unnamed protein product [Naegleria fowleri]
MAKPKKIENSSSSSDQDAQKTDEQRHIVLEDRLFHETARLLLFDDIQAHMYASDPSNHSKNLAAENSIVHNPFGVKRRRVGKSPSSKDNSSRSSFKIPFLQLEITFAQIMIACIVLLIAAVAFMKITSENTPMVNEEDIYEKIDYFEVLEVPKGSPLKLIKKAFRKQTRQWHPDRNPDCGEVCVKKMALISEAHTVLSNEELTKWHLEKGYRVPDSMLKKAARARD